MLTQYGYPILIHETAVGRWDHNSFFRCFEGSQYKRRGQSYGLGIPRCPVRGTYSRTKVLVPARKSLWPWCYRNISACLSHILTFLAHLSSQVSTMIRTLPKSTSLALTGRSLSHIFRKVSLTTVPGRISSASTQLLDGRGKKSTSWYERSAFAFVYGLASCSCVLNLIGPISSKPLRTTSWKNLGSTRMVRHSASVMY